MTKKLELKKTTPHLLNTTDYKLNLSVILVNKLCAHSHISAHVIIGYTEACFSPLEVTMCSESFINIILLIQIFNELYMTSPKGNNP